MKTFILIAMLGSPLTATAMAQPPSEATTAPVAPSARDTVHAALEAEAPLPATPPTLPDTASQRARDVHATIAFGQKGASERAAHAHASDAAADAASRVRSDAANRAAQGAAASAARSANADSHAAAGQNRANAVHGQSGSNGNAVGNGHARTP